jgi:hypothetical protein
MYQSMVEGRAVPWSLLVKDMPRDKYKDLDYLVEQLDWAANVNPKFKDSHYLEPIIAAGGDGAGYVDRWIVYGKVDGEQLFTARELTVDPGATVTIKDNGAYGLIAVQGCGRIGKLALQTPAMIRFGELTEDEVFVTHDAAQRRRLREFPARPLVTLRYFGPDTNPNAPKVGDQKRRHVSPPRSEDAESAAARRASQPGAPT